VPITRDSINALQAPSKPGRPRALEPLQPLSTCVTAADYDRIASAARAQGVSVAAFVRAKVRAALRDKS
jgi:hypothetical protein